MHIKGPAQFPFGYNEIATIGDKEQKSMMDFGILRLAAGESFYESQKLERAYLLIKGDITLEWEDFTKNISRENCFDSSPWVLHVPNDIEVTITANAESEIAIHRTENERVFSSKLYTPLECASENRGAGTMRETSTRIVRTVFDQSNAPYSNLILGEVIDLPGKWSSYPPHNHPQPEIYYYRFLPENGYGFAELDENVIKTHHNSTVFIVDEETHPQTSAPGYAMWYLWVIRNLDGDPYIKPHFIPEHLWVIEPDAKIWPYAE
ncbi:MAG: 5-deoxy-glucuronate isomerase [Eubacteriales bacterium]